MSVNQRIKILSQELGLSQRAFAQELGVNEVYFNQVANGKKEASSAILLAISNHPRGINMNWLLRGNGSMFLDQKQQRPAEPFQEVPSPYRSWLVEAKQREERLLGQLSEQSALLKQALAKFWGSVLSAGVRGLFARKMPYTARYVVA